MSTPQKMVNDCFCVLFTTGNPFVNHSSSWRRTRFRIKPTTGIEPVNLILTKDVLYRLSYMGIKQAGNETRTHNSHLGRVELYQLSYARDIVTLGRGGFEPP
jgi:hypothetical protein